MTRSLEVIITHPIHDLFNSWVSQESSHIVFEIMVYVFLERHAFCHVQKRSVTGISFGCRLVYTHRRVYFLLGSRLGGGHICVVTAGANSICYSFALQIKLGKCCHGRCRYLIKCLCIFQFQRSSRMEECSPQKL